MSKDTKDELTYTFGQNKGWWVKLWRNQRIIASVLGISFDYAKDNAKKLISRYNSQPDLLKALKEIEASEARCKKRGVGYDEHIHNISKVAIAKAKKED